jgi:Fe-S oxidoreductase
MAKLKKTNLGEIREKWRLCMNCAACYYHGPIIPHNWLELPPELWDAPLAKCPSFEFFGFRAYTPVGRLNLATVAFADETFPVTDDLLEVLYTCDTCGMCNEICPAYRPVDTILAFRETLYKRGAKRPAPVGEKQNH